MISHWRHPAAMESHCDLRSSTPMKRKRADLSGWTGPKLRRFRCEGESGVGFYHAMSEARAIEMQATPQTMKPR